MNWSKNWGSTTVWIAGLVLPICATVLLLAGKITAAQWQVIALTGGIGVSAKGVASEFPKKNGSPTPPTP